MIAHARSLRALGLCAWLVAPTALRAQGPLTVNSPNGRNAATIEARGGGLFYSVDRGGKHIILPSRLGFTFRGAAALRDSLAVTRSSRSTFDTTWTQPWGEVARVRDQHNELRVEVAELAAPHRTFAVVVRAFDDGIAFRYEVGAPNGTDDFEMTNELTEFTLADDAKAWWIPANKAVRTLIIDGDTAGVLVMPQRGTQAWFNWGWSNALRVELRAGAHTFTIAYTTLDENMNRRENTALLDVIRVTRLRPHPIPTTKGHS